jgi:TRAP-type uncharacterized transport system fused permease subunit
MTAANSSPAAIDAQRAREIEEEFDSERRVRPLAPRLGGFIFLFLIAFSLYHFVTAGIGFPIDHWHMGIHLSGVLFLIFLLYPARRGRSGGTFAGSRWHILGVPV